MEKYDSFTPDILDKFQKDSSTWHGARGRSATEAILDIRQGSYGFAITDKGWLRAICSYEEYQNPEDVFASHVARNINYPIIYIRNLAGAGHNAAWSIMKDLMQIAKFERKALVLQATSASYSFYEKLGFMQVDRSDLVYAYLP